MQIPDEDAGYALISALWLLLLAASLSGLLMLRSVRGSEALVADRSAIRDHLRLDSALETALADMLFYGQASVIARSGGAGRYSVDGQEVTVRASAESARVDINEAPLPTIEATLTQSGVSPDRRASILDMLTVMRAQRLPISSLNEWQTRTTGGTGTEGPPEPCTTDAFSVAGGRTSLAEDAGTNGLANDPHAGASAGGGGSVVGGNGGMTRLNASIGNRSVTIITFPSTTGSEPVAVIDRIDGNGCGR